MKEKKPINIEIGQRIKQSREAAGLTQETFAEMLGLGVKHISAMECGAVGVSLNTIRTICKVLAISSDTLLLENTDKNDVSVMAARLERLSLKQFRIAEDVLNKLIEAFALEENGFVGRFFFVGALPQPSCGGQRRRCYFLIDYAEQMPRALWLDQYRTGFVPECGCILLNTKKYLRLRHNVPKISSVPIYNTFCIRVVINNVEIVASA